LSKAPRLVVPVSIILLVGFASAFALTYTVTVQTDMSSYTGPRATVTVSGIVSPAPGPNTNVIVTTKGPSGAIVDINSVPANATTGAYTYAFVTGGTGNWTTGAYTVNATWGGPGGMASSITTFNYVAPLSKTSTTLTCGSPIIFGSTSTCTLTVGGTSGTVTGETVAISLTGGTAVTLPSPPTCTLSAGGTCSFRVNGTAVGSVTLNAAYPGDSSNAPSQGTASLVVLAATTTTVACTPSSIAIGATATCTATVVGTSGNVANEVVSFSQALGSTGGVSGLPANCPLTSGGTCPITVTGTTVGRVTLSAAYPGDPTNNGMSTGNATITVQPAATTTSTSSTTTSTSTSAASTTSTTSTSTSSTGTVTATVTQTVTQTQSSSSKTSSSQSTSASPPIVIGATTIYAIVAVVVIVLALVGFMMWRRKVAADYEKSVASRK
jgi:hypothetical protein